MLIIATIITILSITCVVLPVRAYKIECKRKKFESQFRYFKFKAVKAFYPALQDLSLREIEERYSLDAVYNAIGRNI